MGLAEGCRKSGWLRRRRHWHFEWQDLLQRKSGSGPAAALAPGWALAWKPAGALVLVAASKPGQG